MVKSVVYIYPEVEGQQNFICWGFSRKAGLDSNKLKEMVINSLEELAKTDNRWVKNRSFSVFMGSDNKNYWIAVPRQLNIQAIKIFKKNFVTRGTKPEIVITSFNNPFGEKLPFQPVVSYDRGFIVDSSNLEENMQKQRIAN